MNGASAQTTDGAVRVEVGDTGQVRAVRLTDAALSLGPTALAHAILDLADEATTAANERARHALPELAALSAQELSMLGMRGDEGVTERVECTTPDTWRAL